MTTESLRFEAGLGTSGFTAGIRTMMRQSEAGAKRVKEAFAGIGSAASQVGTLIGVSFGGAVLANSIRQTLGMATAMNTLGKQTGMTAGQARIFEQQLEAVGLSQSDFVQAIGQLSQELYSGGKQFEALGLDVEKLKRLDPASLFRVTGKAIGMIEDPTQRAAVTMSLLGEEAVKMTAAFTDPNFGRAAGALGAQAALLDQNAGKFAATAAKLREAATVLQNVQLNFASSALDGFNEAFDKTSNDKFQGWLTSFAESEGKGLGLLLKHIVNVKDEWGKLVEKIKGTPERMAELGGMIGTGQHKEALQDIGKNGLLGLPQSKRSPALEALHRQDLKETEAAGKPKSFWDKPDPRLRFEESIKIWMSDDASQRAKNERDRRRFGEKAVQDPEFGKRHLMRDPQDLATASKGPNMSEPYAKHGEAYRTHPDARRAGEGGASPGARNFIRSRTREEREQGLPAGALSGKEKPQMIQMSDKDKADIAKLLAAEMKQALPK